MLKTSEGKDLNLLDLLFIATCKSSKPPVDVLREACKIVFEFIKDKDKKNKIISMMLLARNEVVATNDLHAIKKELIDMGTSFAEDIIKEAVTQGEARRSRQTAVACIKKGMVDSDISEVSLLPITEVAEIRAELGIPALPEENVTLLESSIEPLLKAITYIKDGMDDSLVSKYSHLSMEDVTKIRTEFGIPAPSKNNVIPLESSIDPLFKAITLIKYGLGDSLVSKYSHLSIEDVTKIRAEIEADPKTK